eukprot:Hpha_TRINITY_DN15680_c2_g2::TRINITY_DN15680_c2_g2_i1::g.99897::m.99897/K04842/SCN10A; voltage-gated sodium channel type X alpha
MPMGARGATATRSSSVRGQSGRSIDDRRNSAAARAAKSARKRSVATLDVEKVAASVAAKKLRREESGPEHWSANRRWVRKMVNNDWFERISLTVIVLNCATLSIEDPTDFDCQGTRCRIAARTEYFFIIFFTLEMILKIIAYGVWTEKDAYLRNSWNVLDCIIVLAGIVQLLQPVLGIQGAEMTGIRALRLLRPLKALRSMPSVQVIVMSILACLPQLLNVCLLYFFFVFAMGIIAVQQWKGKFLHHCMDITGLIPDPTDDRPCKELTESIGLGGHHCDWSYPTCIPYKNPWRGILSFDQILSAMLNLYIAISLEGWSIMMYYTMDVSNNFASVFWIILIVIGAFFILSLTIVVITEAFDANSELAKNALREALEATKRGDQTYFEKKWSAVSDWFGTRYGDFAEWLAKINSDSGREFAKHICDHQAFQRIIILFILLNTVQMAVQHHQQPQWMTDVDDCRKSFFCLSNCFNIVFTLEVVLKIYGDGLTIFWSDGFNRFDLFVVITGIAELVGDFLPVSPSVLRSFRVLRILKLAQRFPGLRKWTKIIIRSMKEASVLTVLMVMMLFIAALLGMQFFGGRFCNIGDGDPNMRGHWHCSGLPRLNYDSLHNALVTSFGILSGEDWNMVLVNGMSAAGSVFGLYFVLYHTLSSYVILNLFIAVLLSNRGDPDDEEEDDADLTDDLLAGLPQSPRRIAATFDAQRIAELLANHGVPPRVVQMFQVAEIDGRSFMRFDLQTLQRIGVNEEHWQQRLLREREAFITNYMEWLEHSPDPVATLADQDTMNRLDALLVEFERGVPGEGADLVAAAADSVDERIALYESLVSSWEPEWGDPDEVFAFLRSWAGIDELQEEEQVEVVKTFPWVCLPDWCEDPCPCYPDEDTRCRSALVVLCEHPIVEGIVLAAICASTVTLAVENPLVPPDHQSARFLTLMDMVLTGVFWIELILKSTAYGFFGGPNTYLRRDGWNRLDSFIVMISTIALTVPGMSNLSVFKVLRTLRPLRFIHRVKGMKTAVQGLLRSLPAMANVAAISGLIMLIFGILGMQLFAGTSYRCSDQDYGDVTNPRIRDSRVACLEAGFRWEAYKANFDNLGNAVLALFEVASLEGWIGLMYVSVDGVSFDEGPIFENRPELAYYFVLFIIIGSFFMVNLFIGVLIDAYTTEKETSGGLGMFLSNHQKEWLRAHKSLRAFMTPGGAMRPKEINRCRRYIFEMVTHPAFDIAITLCITLNICVMAMEHHGGSEAFLLVMEDLNLFFVAVFAVEAALKMIGLGVKEYFGDAWNRFDLLIVVLSTTPLLIELGFAIVGVSTEAGQASIASQFRMLRLARLLRMVKQAGGVRALLRTLLYSLPSFSNIAALILLVFFIFAVMGLNLFGKVGGEKSEEINRHANFYNVFNAFLLMVRMATGEAWQGIMRDAMQGDPYCDRRLAACANPVIAPIFFCCFTLLCNYILLNLFVAVILDGSSEASLDFQPEDWDMETVRGIWDSMCVLHLNAIEENKLEVFLRKIGPPLGPPANCTARQYRRFLLPLDLKSRGGYLLQRELFPKLVEAAFGADLPDEKSKELDTKVNALAEKDPMADKVAQLGDPVPVNNVMEVVLVQAHIKGWLERHRRRKLRECLKELVAPDATPDSLLCIRCPAALARIPEDVALQYPYAKLTCQLCGRYCMVSEDVWAYCPHCIHSAQMHEVCSDCLPEVEDKHDAPLQLQTPRRGGMRERSRSGIGRPHAPATPAGPQMYLGGRALEDNDGVSSFADSFAMGLNDTQRLRLELEAETEAETRLSEIIRYWTNARLGGHHGLVAAAAKRPVYSGVGRTSPRQGLASSHLAGSQLAASQMAASGISQSESVMSAGMSPRSLTESGEDPGMLRMPSRRRKALPAKRQRALSLSNASPKDILRHGMTGDRCGDEALAAARACRALPSLPTAVNMLPARTSAALRPPEQDATPPSPSSLAPAAQPQPQPQSQPQPEGQRSSAEPPPLPRRDSATEAPGPTLRASLPIPSPLLPSPMDAGGAGVATRPFVLPLSRDLPTSDIPIYSRDRVIGADPWRNRGTHGPVY